RASSSWEDERAWSSSVSSRAISAPARARARAQAPAAPTSSPTMRKRSVIEPPNGREGVGRRRKIQLRQVRRPTGAECRIQRVRRPTGSDAGKLTRREGAGQGPRRGELSLRAAFSSAADYRGLLEGGTAVRIRTLRGVNEIFGPGGRLATTLPGYEQRAE